MSEAESSIRGLHSPPILAFDNADGQSRVQKSLSEAQLRQRRDAAKSRWRKFREGAAVVAGAGAAGVAADAAVSGIVRAGNREKLERFRSKMARKRRGLDDADAEAARRKIANLRSAASRTEAELSSRRAKASVAWPVPRRIEEIKRDEIRQRSARLRNRDYMPDGFPVIRDIDKEISSHSTEGRLAARRIDLEAARKPKRVSRSETTATRRTAEWMRRVRRPIMEPTLDAVDSEYIGSLSGDAAESAKADAIMDWMRNASKRRQRTTYDVDIPMRGKVGAKINRAKTTQRVPPSISPKALDRMRRDMLTRIDGKVRRLRSRVDDKVSSIAGGAAKAKATRAASMERHLGRLGRNMARYPGGKARAATALAGAIIGGTGAYLAVKKGDLAKNAPPDGPLGGIGEIAGRLTRAFMTLRERAAEIIDRLRDDPNAPDTRYRDLVRDALDPLGRPFTRAARRVVEGEPTIAVSFDLIEPRVFTHFDEYRMGLVRQITDGQTETLRRTLTTLMASGATIDSMARRIRDTVGLTTWQAQNVANYRAELESADPLLRRRALGRELRDKRYDRTVIRTLATDEPLDRAKVDAMVEAYQRRYIALRATTIARTEALRASNLGSYAAAQEAADAYNLVVEKTWLATDDERTRADHRALNGKSVVGMNTPFILSDGRTIRFPHDPTASADLTVQCRCTCQMRLIPRRGLITNLSAEAV